MGWVEEEVTVTTTCCLQLGQGQDGDTRIPGSSLQLHVFPKLADLPWDLVTLLAGPEMRV